jgi:hypothetical protein
MPSIHAAARSENFPKSNRKRNPLRKSESEKEKEKEKEDKYSLLCVCMCVCFVKSESLSRNDIQERK